MAELELAELVEAWAGHEEDILIGEDGNARYGRHLIADAVDGSPDWRAIKAWCAHTGYFPNVWTVNDHGNVELHDVDGNSYGGLV